MSAPRAALVAQAKLNLFLRILAREDNGYHQLETLLARLDLGDVVRVAATDGRRSLDWAGLGLAPGALGPTEQNLAWRAALAFADAAGWPTGFEIEIEKRIPPGGGLGGGSADAGAVLRILNALAPSPLPRHRLLAIAGGLGADVPFLTQDRSPLCVAWGRGDRLLALPPLASRDCVLVVAPFGVSTGDAYRWYAESGPTPVGASLSGIEALGSWAGVDALSFNAFEGVVLAHVPALNAAFEGLVGQRDAVGLSVIRMTGSGSSLFGLSLTDGVPATVRVPDGFATIQTRTSATVFGVVRDA